MEKLRLMIVKLGKFMDILGGIFVTFVMLITVCDVALRYFGKPVLGTYELVSFGGALAIGISSLATYAEKSHIRVDAIVEKLPKKANHILYIVTRIITLLIVGWTGFNLIVMGFHLLEAKELSWVLRFPYYPIVWALGVSFLLVCLAVLYEIISGREVIDNE